MTDGVALFLVVSFCFSVIGVLLRAVLITIADYPRTTKWTVGQDVGALLGGFVWLFWVAWLLWGGGQ